MVESDVWIRADLGGKADISLIGKVRFVTFGEEPPPSASMTPPGHLTEAGLHIRNIKNKTKI